MFVDQTSPEESRRGEDSESTDIGVHQFGQDHWTATDVGALFVDHYGVSEEDIDIGMRIEEPSDFGEGFGQVLFVAV